MSLVIDLIDLVAKHKSGELRCPATALIRKCDVSIKFTYFVFMPPTLKKLERHIAFGLSVCVSVCVC